MDSSNVLNDKIIELYDLKREIEFRIKKKTNKLESITFKINNIANEYAKYVKEFNNIVEKEIEFQKSFCKKIFGFEERKKIEDQKKYYNFKVKDLMSEITKNEQYYNVIQDEIVELEELLITTTQQLDIYQNSNQGEEKMENQHKHAIIIIRNDKDKYLQNYDERWSGYLFLNCKVENELDVDKIKATVNEKLNIDFENITVSYVMDKIHTKFSQSAKIDKTYHHYFFNVVINEMPEVMLNNEFIINDTNYKWFSMQELQEDERIQEINSDIVGFVKTIEKKLVR